MNIEKTFTREYRFTDLNEDVMAVGNPPLRVGVINFVVVTVSRYNDGTVDFSDTCTGCKCKQNGEIDGRSRPNNYIYFPNYTRHSEYILSLVKQTGDEELVKLVESRLACHKAEEERDRRELLESVRG